MVANFYLLIYIFTNLLTNSVYGDKEKEKNARVIERKKEKANLVTPIDKNQEIRNQLVKLLRCYNYKECSIQGRAKFRVGIRYPEEPF